LLLFDPSERERRKAADALARMLVDDATQLGVPVAGNEGEGENGARSPRIAAPRIWEFASRSATIRTSFAAGPSRAASAV